MTEKQFFIYKATYYKSAIQYVVLVSYLSISQVKKI